MVALAQTPVRNCLKLRLVLYDFLSAFSGMTEGRRDLLFDQLWQRRRVAANVSIIGLNFVQSFQENSSLLTVNRKCGKQVGRSA